MKKLLFIPLLFASLFLCACQSSDAVDYTSQLRLNITHIDESDAEKEIHITYPVFGGIENKEAVTIINTSISNFVNSQYDEFQKALTSTEQDELSDTSDILHVKSNDDADSDAETDGDNEDSNNNADSDAETDGDNEDSDNNADDDEGADDAESTDETKDDSTSAGEESGKKNSDLISLNMNFKITYNKNNYISVVQTYDKDLGENKEFSGQRSFFFSLENAAYLSLGEIFDFEGEFPTYINEKIKESLNNGAYTTYDDNSGFTGISKNNKFYIDNNNLYIYYDALEISPDKDSIPIFAFKLSDVKSYAKEDLKNIF